MAQKKAVTEKKERAHIATVLQVRHGGFFNKHFHYHVNILEVNADEMDERIEAIERAARNAVKTANQIGLGSFSKVLTVQKVEITTIENARQQGADFRKLINEL